MVDAKTGAPVAGAVVVAAWAIRPKYVEGAPLALGALEEGVTGSRGWYWLPGWIKVYRGQPGTLSGEPNQWILARGYVVGETNGGIEIHFDATTRRNSTQRRYLTQSLMRAPGDDQDTVDTSLEYVWLSLIGLPRPAGRCPWSGIPNTIAHLTSARRALEEIAIATELPSVENLSQERWCEGLPGRLSTSAN